LGCGGFGLPPAAVETALRRSTLACRGRAVAMPAEVVDGLLDQVRLRECIQAQRCPWCGRAGLRSLANHTVTAHQIYAHELRELAGLPADAPLCSPALSECHRDLAREHDTTQWLHRPEVRLAGAATREARYGDEQRRRRVEQLDAVRDRAIQAYRRWLAAEKDDPELAAARRIVRSKANKKFRAGAECPICGVWFCSVVPRGQDYRQRKYCSDACRGEAVRRLRRRTWMRRALQTWGVPASADT
jgi:predicted transcriptional regulator